MRQAGFHLKHGYVVMAIPDSGLFLKDGRLVSGHQTDMKFDELILYSRDEDANKLVDQLRTQWADPDANGHQWNFHVLPVLVHERL
jgi:hypothetical protein